MMAYGRSAGAPEPPQVLGHFSNATAVSAIRNTDEARADIGIMELAGRPDGTTTLSVTALFGGGERQALAPLFLRDEQATTFVSIEEENRNSLSLHLSRPIAGGWSGETRFAVYSDEFTNDELSFQRWTAYLGAVYRYDPSR